MAVAMEPIALTASVSSLMVLAVEVDGPEDLVVLSEEDVCCGAAAATACAATVCAVNCCSVELGAQELRARVAPRIQDKAPRRLGQ